MKKLLASALVLTGCMVAFSAPAYAAFFSSADRGDASTALEHRGAVKDVSKGDVGAARSYMQDRRSSDESVTQKRDWAKGEAKQAYTHPSEAMGKEMGIAGKGMNKEVDLYQQSQERRNPALPPAEPTLRQKASFARDEAREHPEKAGKEIWENRGDVRGHGDEAREGAAKAKSWF